MKKKKVQSSNGFESSADIPIDVRLVFEERRLTYQEKKGIFRIASFDPLNLLIPAELQPIKVIAMWITALPPGGHKSFLPFNQSRKKGALALTVSLTSAGLQGEFRGLESSFLMYRIGSQHCLSTCLN